MIILEKLKELKGNVSKIQQYIDFCNDNAVSKIKGKTSHHHILPKKLFPEYSNLNENPWNGVHLLYSDHYYAHWLLSEAVDNYTILSAFCSMHNKDLKNGRIEEKDLIRADEFQKKMEERSRKHSILLHSLQKNGKSVATNNALKAAKTMKEVQDDGMTIYEKANIKQHKTKFENKVYKDVTKKMIETKRNDIDDFGINGLQRHALKAAKTMKEVQDDGMTIYEKAIEKRLKTVYKNQKKYNIVHIDGSIYKENLFMKEIKEISAALPKTNKEKFLGNNSYSLGALKRNKSEHLFGLYIVEN